MKPPNPTGPRSEPAEKQDIASEDWSGQEMKEKHPCGIVELCRYLEVFLHTIQEDHFGPEFFKLGLELRQHQFAIRPFGIHTLFNRWYWKLCIYVYIECSGFPTFIFSFLLNQLLVEISRFLQILCFHYQLLLQFLFKGPRTNHTGGPKITPHGFQWKKPSGVSSVSGAALGFSFLLSSPWQQIATALLKWNEKEVSTAHKVYY